MNVISPSFIQPESALDIVGFNLQSAASESSSRIITFSQALAPGALMPTDGLNATINGVTQRVQVNAKTFNADGSISLAVLTLLQPAIGVGDTLRGLLSKTTSVSGSNVDLGDLLSKHAIKVNINFDSGSVSTLDIGAALRGALSDGTAEVWLSGSLATQARVSVLVSGSLRLVATITALADGTFSANVGFNNDIAMSASGGQNLVNTNIQHDPAYLEKFGAIPNFDLANGVDPGKLDFYNQQIVSPGWGSPLASNDVYQAMPATGGRPDIGITTEPNASWLITQDAGAGAFALGQADASGAAPWNYWDNDSGTWLNTDSYPKIWVDGRGGTSDHGSVGLTQPDTGNSGWQLDTSHQPDLSYYAFMMTGNEKYLDGLNAQASYAVTSTWEAYRGSDQLVVGYDQVRASAWNLREIDEAVWANPPDSLEGKYFQKVADSNWKWLVAQIPAWTINQGQAYGQMEGYAWGSKDYSRPWMQDYFAGVVAEAAKHGNTDALTFLKWESNFLVGRFLNGDNGFNPRDGVSYTIALGPDSADGNVRYKTWSEIGTATYNAGESNGNGYGNSIGDYGVLGLNTLSDIISVLGSIDAIKAYNWLLSSGAPFTSAADRASNVQFNIVPKLPAGWAFASDGTIYLLPAVVSVGGETAATPSTPVTVIPVIPPSSSEQPVRPPASATTIGSGPNSLTLQMSEDAWNGDAQFTIQVDGKQIGNTQTTNALHSAGQNQAFTVLGDFAGAHTATVTFLNDAYGGTASMDRNLYVDSASFNGANVSGASLIEDKPGPQSFGFHLI